jgi:hypothetical protein
LASRARLLSTKGQDAVIWHKVFEALPDESKDIFFLPEYASIYEQDGQEAKAFLLEHEEGYVLYPFLVRTVQIDGNAAFFNGTQARDIATPYGFGGPVATSDSPELYSTFSRLFTSWCVEEQLASEFMCPHLFTGTIALIEADNSYAYAVGKPTVFIDLDGTAENIWGQLNRGHRSAVNHARKHGVVVEKIIPNASYYEIFNKLYTATMDRHGAAKRWYHPADYFRRCYEALGAAHCSFFVARIKSAIAAWFIVLHGYDTAYYHFAGSDLDYSQTKASQLLMHEVSLWSQQQGFRRLFLGGGTSAEADDSLLRYKLGFSKNIIQHVTAWRILNTKVYDKLTREKEAAEVAACGRVLPREYFPAYRH